MAATRVGFGPRLAAAIIDAAVILALTAGIGGTAGALLGGGAARALQGAGSEGAAAGAALGAILGAALGAAAALNGVAFLYSLVEALAGASPGKMALGLKAGLADGRTAPTGTYVARWAVKYAGALLGLAGVVPGLHALAVVAPAAGLIVFVGCFLALGDRRQALHDLVAGTAVFRRADLARRLAPGASMR